MDRRYLERYRQHLLLVLLALTAVDDISAQSSCTVTPINPPTLTAAGGVLANGTENVTFECNCSFASSDVRWYDPNGDIVRTTTTNRYVPGSPYRVDGDNVVALVIPTFIDLYDGNYTCRRRDTIYNESSPTVTLTIAVNDVSAQTSCVINPHFNMLTIKNQLGRDVDLHCQCMDDNGIITGTRWFLPDMSIVSTDSSNRPYSTGTAPSRLLFSSPFTNSDTGTYTCSPNDTFPTIPPGDSITLNTAVDYDPKEYVNCSIVSTNLPNVTAAGGVITNGTQNVILYCICMRVNSTVTVGRTFWFFNGTPITRTQNDGSGNPYSRDNVPSTLTIPSFVTPHDGNYSCAHSNNFSVVATLGDTITLTLTLPGPFPTISAQPNDEDVEVYGTVSFKCTAQGIGINITWKRMKYNMPVTAKVTEMRFKDKVESTLNIAKVVGYYKGEYYCVAENESGITISQAAKLIVKVPKPEIIISPENITVLPGNNFSMNCLALSLGLLKYEWSKRNEVLPETAVHMYIHSNPFDPLSEETTSVYNLAVHNVKPSDEGWYCCEATNEAGSTKNCAWLEVYTLPNITTQPVPINFTAGDFSVFAMSCLAVGVVPITYRWEKYNSSSGTWISPSHRALNITSPNLAFSIVTKQDEGVYHCIVTSDDDSVISKNATIIVYCPPINFSNRIVLLEAQKVNLICIAADPIHSRQINWYKGNNSVMPDDNRVILYDEPAKCLNSTLLIDPVNRTDDGIYTCRAFNLNSSFSESKINLTIEYPSSVHIVNPSPYKITVGSLAILYCASTGKPISRVQWYKNHSPVNPFYSLLHQSYLIPTKTPHTTVYTCKGWNTIKNTQYTSSANVTVIVA